MKKLIIEIQKGGLGDHLFYSHLPRIAKETGSYDYVYLSEHTLFRNAEYRKLVWECNPYVDGFVEEKGICHFPENVQEDENLLDNIMLSYGLDDGIRFHEPEIYYQPLIKPELKEAVIYDPNFISYTGDLANGKPIENWLYKHGKTVDYQMKQINKRYLGINITEQVLSASSLFDFCSIIVSAKHIYCLTTGTATLAAAFNIPVTVFFGTGHDSKYRHSKLHTFIDLGTNFGLTQKLRNKLIRFLQKIIPLGTP